MIHLTFTTSFTEKLNTVTKPANKFNGLKIDLDIRISIKLTYLMALVSEVACKD